MAMDKLMTEQLRQGKEEANVEYANMCRVAFSGDSSAVFSL